MFSVSGSFAQSNYGQDQRDVAKNEFSLNVLDIFAFGSLNIGYEYILSDHSSFSAEMFNKLFNKSEGEKGDLSKVYSKDFALTTKFKYFFNENVNSWGYYAKAFVTFSHGFHETGDEYTDPETGSTTEIKAEFTDLAPGLGAGAKFITKQGYFVDLGVGFGKNMFHRYSPDFVVISNINLGYRF